MGASTVYQQAEQAKLKIRDAYVSLLREKKIGYIFRIYNTAIQLSADLFRKFSSAGWQSRIGRILR